MFSIPSRNPYTGFGQNAVHGCQRFLASGSWVCPEGVFWADITASGGGGGGGSGPAAGMGGAGGAGGVLVEGICVAVTPGTSYAVTIGAGGAASSAGGTTSFGSLVSAAGGAAGAQGLAFSTDTSNQPGQTGGGNGGGISITAAAANTGAGGGGGSGGTAAGAGGSGYLTVRW